MYRLLLGLLTMGFAALAQANPVVVCTGGAPQTAVTGFGPFQLSFVLVPFTPKCSNNVILSGEDKQTYFAAASASMKGNNVYMGSTANGDMVIYTAPCAGNTASGAGNCKANDVSQGQIRASAISS